jgi:hypothetical protein
LHKRKVFLDIGTHFGDGLMRHVSHYKIDESWEIHTFEANPYTFKEFEKVREETRKDALPSNHLFRWILWNNVSYHNKAIWVFDGEVEFNCCSAEKTESLLSTSQEFSNWMKQQETDVSSGKQICIYHKFDMPTDGASSIISPKKMDRNNVNYVQKLFEFKAEDKVNVRCVDLSSWLKQNISDEDFLLVKMDIEGAEFEVLQKCLDDETITKINQINIEWHDWCRPDKKNHRQYIINEMSRLGVQNGLWM